MIGGYFFAGLSAGAGLSAPLRFADFLNCGRTQSLYKSFAFAGRFPLSAIESKLSSHPKENAPTLCVEAFVPRTGIEPALPCDNQILSLARLPVPPSGHFAPRCSAGCNITLSAEFCQNTIEVFFLVVILFYLQHCFLGNRIDLIHFQIVFNRFQDFILYSFNLI